MLRSLASLPILLLATPVLLTPAVSLAQVVPGTGVLVNSDDFENTDFSYDHRWPKSSKEEDEQVRHPLGGSNNGMWLESPKRGAPDVVKRVETPAGGLAGSTGALYLRSRDTGIPGRPSGKQCQDDLILRAKPMPISYTPNFTVRVYLPEWDQWDQRNMVSFGLRAGLQGPQEKNKAVSIGRLFKGIKSQTVTEMEPYYPGFFIQFVPGNDPRNTTGQPYAMLLLRANELGHEVPGPIMKQTGWWTLGMSITPDARCHYYAKPGVEDLTQADYITSLFPYRIPGTYFNTIFFNVVSIDNGRDWSTPWIIDDPKVYYATGAPVQQARR